MGSKAKPRLARPTAQSRPPGDRTAPTPGESTTPTPEPTPPPRKARGRRSFSQRNLALETDGPLGPLLGEALRVPADETGYSLTHAFHPYPGRFHPALPRTVLKALARPGQHVLDPFMGGGTTLVEAQRLGLAASGNDLNPVATLVARERTRPRTPGEAARLEDLARHIAGEVDALRSTRNAPRLQHPAPQFLMPHYLPHLLAELMQWLRLIDAAPAGPLRESLRAVFSSAVVKFSNLASDSQAQAGTAPRYPKGAVSRFLVGKCSELAQAQVQLGAQRPPGTPPPVLYQEDARLLPSLAAASCDLVLTSPPYPGTYDYHDQHRLRMDWLQLNPGPFQDGEIGARRHHDQPAPGHPATPREGWSESQRAVLAALGRVLRPGGSLLIVMGDWIANEHAVDAAAMLNRTAGARDWQLVSRASMQRDVHSRVEARAFSKRGKWEHLLHFSRPGPEAPPPAERDAIVVQAADGAQAQEGHDVPDQPAPDGGAARPAAQAKRAHDRTPRARREQGRMQFGAPKTPAPAARPVQRPAKSATGAGRSAGNRVPRPARPGGAPHASPGQEAAPPAPSLTVFLESGSLESGSPESPPLDGLLLGSRPPDGLPPLGPPLEGLVVEPAPPTRPAKTGRRIRPVKPGKTKPRGPVKPGRLARPKR